MDKERLAIFDLDGTLLDTAMSICDTLRLTLHDLNLPQLAERQILDSIGMPLKEILLPLKLPPIIEVTVVKRFRELLLMNIQHGVKTFSGAIQFVTELERNSVHLSVATSKPTLLAKESMKFSVLRSFNFTILGSDGLQPKPNPEVVQRVIDQYPGVRNVVMFGDRVEDMQAARAAGIQAVGIAQSAHRKDQLLTAGAQLAYNNFHEANREFDIVYELFTSIRHVP